MREVYLGCRGVFRHLVAGIFVSTRVLLARRSAGVAQSAPYAGAGEPGTAGGQPGQQGERGRGRGWRRPAAPREPPRHLGARRSGCAAAPLCPAWAGSRTARRVATDGHPGWANRMQIPCCRGAHSGPTRSDWALEAQSASRESLSALTEHRSSPISCYSATPLLKAPVSPCVPARPQQRCISIGCGAKPAFPSHPLLDCHCMAVILACPLLTAGT